MSEHNLEDVIELSVKHIAQSDEFSTQEKRDLIYSLFQIQEMGDCGFTHLRTIEDMATCQYTFLFDKNQMYDYEEKRDIYDNNPQARSEYRNGGVYIYGDKFCVDSGSEAWAEMVKTGAIAGEGALPVKRVDNFMIVNLVGEIFHGELLTGDEWFQGGVGSFAFYACVNDQSRGREDRDRFLDDFYNKYCGGTGEE